MQGLGINTETRRKILTNIFDLIQQGKLEITEDLLQKLAAEVYSDNMFKEVLELMLKHSCFNITSFYCLLSSKFWQDNAKYCEAYIDAQPGILRPILIAAIKGGTSEDREEQEIFDKLMPMILKSSIAGDELKCLFDNPAFFSYLQANSDQILALEEKHNFMQALADYINDLRMAEKTETPQGKLLVALYAQCNLHQHACEKTKVLLFTSINHEQKIQCHAALMKILTTYQQLIFIQEPAAEAIADTAKDIVQELNKYFGNTVSKFPLSFLQSLPMELRFAVCKQLTINKDEKPYEAIIQPIPKQTYDVDKALMKKIIHCLLTSQYKSNKPDKY